MKRHLLAIWIGSVLLTACGWTEGQEEKYIDACEKLLLPGGDVEIDGKTVPLTGEVRTKLCNCFATKMEESHPNFSDAMDASDEEKEKLLNACVEELQP